MKTILYVEDNEDNIYMLSQRLQRENFEVMIARNGVEGLQMAQHNLPALIIMDLVLPKMDGFDAARQLRASEKTAHIPLIALSASVLPEHQYRAIEAGCDDFEVKPVDFPKLLKKIHDLLNASAR